jgi:hypothetical protein
MTEKGRGIVGKQRMFLRIAGLAVLLLAAPELATRGKRAIVQRWSGVYSTTTTDTRVLEAYQIARDHPELLSRLPCVCGCMKNRYHHASNFDCFKTDHAETCPACVSIALDAARLNDQGASVETIQRYVRNVHEFRTH